jgi:endogenous inhibitor of DNA gyrase (YacG/DUF329 family)
MEPIATSKCVYCGTEYQPLTRKPRRFCSKRCNEKHWAENNRQRLRDYQKKHRSALYKTDKCWVESGPKAKAQKVWMIKIKSQPCHDCGGTFPTCAMDFDHRVDEVKSYNLGSMFAHHYSRELIEIELAKCDLVCANCHRVRTRDRRLGSGKS